jgi:putative colanic acid biosynthesis acetyltransferase WcaB
MSVFCDWDANAGNLKGRVVLTAFRFAHACRRLPEPWWKVTIPILLQYEILVEWVLGVELRNKTQVGPGLRLYHGQGLVVHEGTVIGADCTLRQSTTIGNKTLADGTLSGCPVLGDRVDVGANAVILGPVRIGDDAVIGAGSVVVKDVPAGAVVAGNPARVLRSPAE